jgi:hypothetical protein
MTTQPQPTELLCLDVLPNILKLLTSVNEIIRMERVCRTFWHCAHNPQSWSHIKTIDINDCFHNGNYYINQIKISARFISRAVKSILIRSGSVNTINLRWCKCPIAYSSVSNTISENVASFRYLRRLDIDGQCASNITQYIVTLCEALQSQLKSLKVRNLDFDTTSTVEWWKVVKECVNLKTIEIDLGYDDTTTPDMVKSALRYKAIQSLALMGNCVTADELIEIISSVDKRTSLRHLGCGTYGSLTFSLAEFAARLPTAHLTNLKSFNYYNCWQSLLPTDSTFAVLMRLPRLCPRLKYLTLTIDRDLSAIVMLIASYLSIQNDSAALHSITSNLIVMRFHLSWGERKIVCESLVKQHNCDVLFLRDKFDEEFNHIRLGRRGSIHLYLL